METWRWRETLHPRSLQLLEKLYALFAYQSYLVIERDERLLFSNTHDGEIGKLHGVFSAVQVCELVDWGLIVLQGTSDGKVPAYWDGSAVQHPLLGCRVMLSDSGLSAAQTMSSAEEM